MLFATGVKFHTYINFWQSGKAADTIKKKNNHLQTETGDWEVQQHQAVIGT